MLDFYRRHTQSVDRVLFVLLVVVSVYAFFNFLFVYLGPFFFGLLIALAMEPLIRLLTRRFKLGRWIAALLCMIIFLGAVASLGVFVVSTFVRQLVNFAQNAPQHVEEVSARLAAANVWLERFGENLPEGTVIPPIEEVMLLAVGGIFGDALRVQGLQILTNVPDFFINLILALVSSYFFMADRARIFSAVQRAAPRWLKQQMSLTRVTLARAMGGYLRAQGILMGMVGAVSLVGLLILGSPYALVLSLLLAVLDFVPILGPALVLLPWAAAALIMGNFQQTVGLLVIYAVMTILRQVLQPKILGSQIGAHPLASLMSIFIGFRVFGLAGLVIGPGLLLVFLAVRAGGAEPDKAPAPQVNT